MKFFFSALALICVVHLALAQTSKSTVAPDKSTRAVSGSTNKPLTPKTAMPAQRKPSAPLPATNDRNQKTSAELSRLERGDKLGSSPTKSTAATKAPLVKSPSSEHSPPLNAGYRKPSTNTTVKKPGH